MSRRNKKMTSQKIRTWIAEGRGQGRGSDYKPWLTGQDVSVDSFSVRIKSLKHSGRHYEALSLIEADYFKILSWFPNVTELREQYPLLPLEETQEIAQKLNVEHPSFQGEQTVMTTDALISYQGNIGIFDTARAVKFSEKLNDPRVIEKLEIERYYWERRGINWRVLTELDIPQALKKNVSWIYHRFHVKEVDLSEREIDRVATLLTKWVIEKDESLAVLAADCDDQLGLLPGNSLSVARHLIAQRRWLVDMNQLIKPGRRLTLLRST